MHQSQCNNPNNVDSGQSGIHPSGVGIQVEKGKRKSFHSGLMHLGNGRGRETVVREAMHSGKRHGPQF